MSTIDRVEARIKELKNMTINMEVKKDGLLQKQDGSWKLTLTVNGDDMSIELIQAAMGSPYGLAMVPIQYDDTPPNLDHFESYKENRNVTTKITTEKSEGDKLRQRACILCGEASFQKYVQEVYVSLDECELGETAENLARCMIVDECNIDSRKELVTNKEAQEKFRELDRAYIEWGKPSVDEQYKHNLEM
tara:strand:- start:859 stop:1431 length:573 start_codon:yes stop_codon:yes gene_type:complete